MWLMVTFLNQGDLGACSPRKILKFKTPETASGGHYYELKLTIIMIVGIFRGNTSSWEEGGGPLITFVHIVMTPLKCPTAKYCPSLVQQQQQALARILLLVTDFCSGDQRPAQCIHVQCIYIVHVHVHCSQNTVRTNVHCTHVKHSI